MKPFSHWSTIVSFIFRLNLKRRQLKLIYGFQSYFPYKILETLGNIFYEGDLF